MKIYRYDTDLGTNSFRECAVGLPEEVCKCGCGNDYLRYLLIESPSGECPLTDLLNRLRSTVLTVNKWEI